MHSARSWHRDKDYPGRREPGAQVARSEHLPRADLAYNVERLPPALLHQGEHRTLAIDRRAAARQQHPGWKPNHGIRRPSEELHRARHPTEREAGCRIGAVDVAPHDGGTGADRCLEALGVAAQHVGRTPHEALGWLRHRDQLRGAAVWRYADISAEERAWNRDLRWRVADVHYDISRAAGADKRHIRQVVVVDVTCDGRWRCSTGSS